MGNQLERERNAREYREKTEYAYVAQMPYPILAAPSMGAPGSHVKKLYNTGTIGVSPSMIYPQKACVYYMQPAPEPTSNCNRHAQFNNQQR
jgi:hypothetical protein